MMRKRTTAAVALAAASVVLLSACGGESGGDADDIKGADSAKKPSPSASATADNIDRPAIKLPKDVSNVFEGEKTGDPKKDAVLADNERRLNSVDEAVTVDAKKHPALEFYSSGDALLSAAQYVKSFYDAKTSWSGETRYYQREVTFLKGDAATVSYCSDETKAYSKDRKTQKVTKTPGDADDYTFYSSRVEKNKKGVWQTVSVTSEEGAAKCQP